MPWNKISGLVNLPAAPLPMSIPAGDCFYLPVGQGVIGGFGSIAAPQLGSGNPLTGQYFIQLGVYTTLQVYDSALNYWRNVNVAPMSMVPVSSDGTNFRIANSTGCPIGAIITGAGSGGTNGFFGYNNQGAAINIINGVTSSGNSIFTITPSAGGSLWNAIVGGMVNATISVSGTVYQNSTGFNATSSPGMTASGGSNYTIPPLIMFTPPPNQGAQPYVLPTAVCTISGGAINSVTLVSQGAGLLGLPGITVIPAPGDTTGGGAVLGWLSANTGQVNSGKASLMWPIFYGTAQTSVPTFTYGGSASPGPTATAIMNFTITGFTATASGNDYGTTPGGVFIGGIVAGTPANNSPGNPQYDKGLSLPVAPPINVASTTAIPTLANPNFGGVNFQAAPSYVGITAKNAAITTVVNQPPTVGGASDTIWLMPI